ncbi:4-(cytidine 5'-diphospho)-2-C-methyl-D-erythritol kinase [Cryptobacterium curtum]
MQTINLIAPAKVNLFLGVGRLQPDGYHEVTTVMQALALHDTIHMTLVSSGEQVVLAEPCDEAQPIREHTIEVPAGSGLSVSVNMQWREGIAPADITDQDNLACRAVRVLARLMGRTNDEHVRLVIEKHIPPQSGLGGGSSDAAAALIGAAALWNVDPTDQVIYQAAQEIGADTAFFLHGGSALLEGRGDILCKRYRSRSEQVVIIRPAEGISTAQAYQTFDKAPVYLCDDMLAVLHDATDASEIPLYNNLQAPAELLLPALSDVKGFIRNTTRAGNAEVNSTVANSAGEDDSAAAKDCLLCGSGSATFAVCESLEEAHALTAAARLAGYWARATSFSSIRAAQLPR